jgi:hypothetical protein
MAIAVKYFVTSTLFLLFLSGIGRSLFAQDSIAFDKAATQRYIKMGIGTGTATTFGFYLAYLMSEKRFYSFDFNYITQNPKYRPRDYSGQFLCIFGDCIPNEEISYFTFSVGHYLVNKHKIRFGLAGGPSFVVYKKVVFEKNEPSGWFDLGPNYNTSYRSQAGIGAALKTMIQFRVLKKLWLEPAFYANINTSHTVYSGNFFISLDFPAGHK